MLLQDSPSQDSPSREVSIGNSSYSDFNRDKAAGLLSKGVSPSQVALALGVTPAVISQYLADPGFSQRVAGARQAVLQSSIARDEKADSLESKLLDKIEMLVPASFKLGEVLNAYKVLNARKRFSDPSQAIDSGAGAPMVTLNLPQTAVNVFVQKDLTGQIISVGSQTLVTMQSSNIDKMASTLKENKNANQYLTGPSPDALNFG
jgi:hypothetical protein